MQSPTKPEIIQERPTSPPAGWYQVPDVPGGMRWWDGRQWTDQVVVPANRTLPEEGQFSTPWMNAGEIAVPSVCCACGEPADPSCSMPVRNSDWMGKLYITVQMPLCALCARDLDRRREDRARAKRIERSVQMKVKRRGFSDDQVQFTFTNRRFAEAFEASQRLRTALLQASAAAAVAAREAAKEQRAAERAAKKLRREQERASARR